MADFLLFQLYAPFVSWGSIAVGEQRPSYDYPSKSAVLGIVAAALGVPRTDEEMHGRLAEAYGFAVAVLAMGKILNDYHTAQVPKQRKSRVYWTRKAEIEALGSKDNAILSYREYRTDTYYKVALWQRIEDAPFDLATLKQALYTPRFSLSLGRKACPPGLPLQACVLQGLSLREAFTRYESDNKLARTFLTDSVQYYWDTELTEEQAGMKVTVRKTYRDNVVSRKRWQFSQRSHNATIVE